MISYYVDALQPYQNKALNIIVPVKNNSNRFKMNTNLMIFMRVGIKSNIGILINAGKLLLFRTRANAI